MSCEKCVNQQLSFKEDASKIYFISEYDELMSKSRIFLMKLNLDVYKIHDLHYIKVYIDYENINFSYKIILHSKPLQRYINMIDDKVFFDIIKNQSLTSHFQPIVRAKDNSIYGYETLIRGVKQNGSLVFPNELFKKSQRNDLNFELDRMCRESALKTAATKKVNKKIFINFIPTSIYDPKFCLNSTIKWAKQLDFDPSNIVFEVVETENVKNQKHLKDILQFYRNEGFKIALDDVGEGYSSLNMIIELKPDIIKVDRNIIENIHADDFKQSVYKALFNLSQDNNIEILAEGVETAYELEVIKEIGVDYLQGYYFSKPMAEPIRSLKG